MARPDTYSKEEIEFIRDNYSTKSWEYLLDGINKISSVPRTKQNIISKAYHIGVNRDGMAYGHFTKEEDALITEVYNNSEDRMLTKNIMALINTKLCNRTYRSVQVRACKLGLCTVERWSAEEVQYVINNYYTMPVKDIRAYIGRSPNAVYLMTKKLGLYDAPMCRYSEESIKFIRDNYETMTDAELGVKLHRAPQSIKECRRKLKLYRRDMSGVTHYRYIDEYIRRHNADWKKRSAKACGYRCMLTNEAFDDIHHLYAENLILKDALDKLSISTDLDINTMDEDMKEMILYEFLLEQEKHPLGICLTGELHRMFHCKYGYGYNVPEQFYEFAKLFPQNRLCLDSIN